MTRKDDARAVRRHDHHPVQSVAVNGALGFLEAWNRKPKPFMWTATVEEIIKKIDRARAKLEQIKPGCTLPKGKRRPMVRKVICETLH